MNTKVACWALLAVAGWTVALTAPTYAQGGGVARQAEPAQSAPAGKAREGVGVAQAMPVIGPTYRIKLEWITTASGGQKETAKHTSSVSVFASASNSGRSREFSQSNEVRELWHDFSVNVGQAVGGSVPVSVDGTFQVLDDGVYRIHEVVTSAMIKIGDTVPIRAVKKNSNGREREILLFATVSTE